ncbi:MAG: hydroxyglutarate oxidase [Deltaproteobacteria bacterium RIFCSPLOWO2_02_FULL_57_26]|nr:MAG: hydroxyglutarate oxidase [Deltaproteobacteria bacterium RIFCSPLOWO2_02_FULL_57_26]
MASKWDLTVVGGGIVGLATALKLAEKHPRRKLLVLEKERELARHQTGHNSGVIHSGIYYKPGSVKAETCVAGRRALLEFCDGNGIPYELCGKVIVATQPNEVARLEELLRQGTANGVQGLELIGPERLREIEPHATGIRALYAPTTGIIDFKQVAQAYAARFQSLGGEIRTSQEVKKIVPRNDGLVIEASEGEFHSRYLINCAGLFSDKLARLMAGTQHATPSTGADLRIIPFRGEYYRLVPKRRFLARGLIYPVPDPRFPFLGAHFTRTVKGEVEVGPNAVLALAREGYRKSDIDPAHILQVFSYRGFWLLSIRYWRMGVEEMVRSVSKRAFVKALQRLVPEVRVDDFIPSGAGVRAQAVSPAGALVDDFVIRRIGNAIHVLNAPSPGATASLAIGKKIVEMAQAAFSLTA